MQITCPGKHVNYWWHSLYFVEVYLVTLLSMKNFPLNLIQRTEEYIYTSKTVQKPYLIQLWHPHNFWSPNAKIHLFIHTQSKHKLIKITVIKIRIS